MLSIIIASVNSNKLKRTTENIANTIGVPYEIISYDNSKDGIGICKIYNLCAAKAKYKNLVFCHDDIIFHTQNWGKSIIATLSDNEIGLLGITGNKFKSKHPAPWVSSPKEFYVSNLSSYRSISIKSDKLEQVAVLDGCFLSLKKSIWEIYPYNEKDLQGFHLYDIDISFRIGRHYKIGVIGDIAIEHLSEGSFDSKWYSDSKLIHDKYRDWLPINLTGSNSQTTYLDNYALRSLIYRSKQVEMQKRELLRFIFQLLFRYPKLFNLRMLKFLLN